MQLPSRKNLVTRWIKKILLRGEKIPPPVRKNWRYFFSDCILGTRGQHLKISTQLSPVWQSTLLMDTPPLPSLKQGWIIFVTSQATYHTVYIYIYISCVHMLKKDLKNMSIQLPMPGPHVTMHLRIPKMKVWKHLPALNQNWHTEETLQLRVPQEKETF